MTPANTNAGSNVRGLHTADLSVVQTTLVSAFQEDPVLRYVVPDKEDWSRISPRYFQMILRRALRDGCSMVDSELRGIGIWEPPGKQVSFSEQLIGLLRMSMLLRGNLSRAFRVQSFTEPYRPRRPHWYLAYVGTAPEHQRSGIGRKVLEPILEQAERDQLPAYLECSSQENLGFYRNLGFTLIDDVSVPDGPTVWPMIREPNRM